MQTTIQRIRSTIEVCRFALISDIAPSKVQGYLAELRRSGLSAASCNHYLGAMKMFVNWLVKDRRTADNPIAGMSKQNADTDRRRIRRPLAWDEFDRLLRAAAAGQEIQGIAGPDRVILYVVACYTGYRRNEIGSVTRDSFDFESSPPTLTVEAGYSKRRRRDVIPLRQDFAGLIQSWLATHPVGDETPLFRVTGKRTSDMVRKDLEAARKAWIEESANDAETRRRSASSFLTYVDEDGRYADFHALRKTFITNLSRAGVSPKLAQTLARHSDINLTMNTYTSLEIHDQSAAVEGLPAIPSIDGPEHSTSELRATGTEGKGSNGRKGGQKALVPQLVQASDVECHRASSRGTEPAQKAQVQETQKPLVDNDFGVVSHPEASSGKSTRGGTRTHTSIRTLDFESEDQMTLTTTCQRVSTNTISRGANYGAREFADALNATRGPRFARVAQLLISPRILRTTCQPRHAANVGLDGAGQSVRRPAVCRDGRLR